MKICEVDSRLAYRIRQKIVDEHRYLHSSCEGPVVEFFVDEGRPHLAAACRGGCGFRVGYQVSRKMATEEGLL